MSDIAIILILIIINGVFSMTEIALVSARKSRLSLLAEAGNHRAKIALGLMSDPDKFLSTIQIGITLIGILTGLFTGAAFARQFGDILIGWGLGQKAAYSLAQVIIVAVVTYLSIVIGELVPKRLGLAMSDKVAVALAPAMKLLSIVALPFVWLLSVSTEAIARLIGLKHNSARVTEDEIKSLIQEGTEAGEVKEVEQDIMERALVLGDQTVNRIMTNRPDLVSLNCRMTNDEIRRAVYADLHRAYPYYCEDIKEVKGLLMLKDILPALETNDPDWESLLTKPTFFPESMTAYDALAVLRNEEVCCGLVCDEFGEVQGIVTLRDVLEGLVGMISNPIDTPRMAPVDDAGNEYIVDGLYKWYDFLAAIDRECLYQPASYSTVAGWFLDTQRHIPHEGEEAEWKSIRFKIINMDGARIDKLLVSIPAPTADGNGD